MADTEVHALQRFTRAQISALLAIGVISGSVPALQPVLLGTLAAAGKISLPQIGQIAMAEALGMAFAASIGGARLPLDKLRPVALIAALVCLAVNLATTQLSGYAVLGARLIGGLCSGMLLVLWIGLLARVEVPARLIAIYVTLQGGLVLALSSFFSNVLIPAGGAAAGYACLAAASLVMALLALAMPRHYQPIAGAGGSHIPRGRGLVGVIAVGIHLAAIMGVWVYVLPLGREAGLNEAAVGLTVSVALASQMIAGVCAAALAVRLHSVAAILVSAAASVAGLALLAVATSLPMFMAGVVLIAFFWMFAPPFMMPYLIVIDPSRTAAMQILTAQLIGVSMGPALASLAVREGAAGGAILVSGALYTAAAALVITTVAAGRRAARLARA